MNIWRTGDTSAAERILTDDVVMVALKPTCSFWPVAPQLMPPDEDFTVF